MRERDWRTGVKVRAAIVVLSIVGLALYGLLGGAAKSVVPLQARSASTPATDRFSVASVEDSSENVDVVTMGPGHSLYFYWLIGGTWYGPLQMAGGGTAFSGPAITNEEAGPPDHLDVAVEGPNHSLLFFWQVNGTWYGPLQIGGPGTTWSAPSITFDTNGNVDVSAQGPNGSVYMYWAIGGAWSGPYGVAGAGTAFSAPTTQAGSLTTMSTCVNHFIFVDVEGPNHTGLEYQDGTLTGPSSCSTSLVGWAAPVITAPNTHYSAASEFDTASVSGVYQGPNNSMLYQLFGTGGSQYCLASLDGTTYSAPGMVVFASSPSGGSVDIAADGPANSLYAYWFSAPQNQFSSCPGFFGPLQLGAAGTAFSIPSLFTQETGGGSVANVLVEGPSHTLWAYWSSNGSWYGPLQIGAQGTTFDSAN